MKRSRLLFALPLLLLVPLLALKWRADHPPLSEADKTLRAVIGRAQQVRIWGNSRLWHEMTGLDAKTSLRITSRETLDEITEALRCKGDAPRFTNVGFLATMEGIFVTVPAHKPGTWQGFLYARNTEGSNLLFASPGRRLGTINLVPVQPRFVPRFEALLSQLARRAKSPGKHPEIVLAERTSLESAPYNALLVRLPHPPLAQAPLSASSP